MYVVGWKIGRKRKGDGNLRGRKGKDTDMYVPNGPNAASS
jgi:hypothetical protein